MKPLSSCFLYGIVDLGYVTVDKVATVTAQLVQGGVDILQLRAKEHSKLEIVRCAQAMLPLTKAAGIPLIINDYPDLLREVDAEGCHVGQEDFSVAEARDLAGRDLYCRQINPFDRAGARGAKREGGLHRIRAPVSDGNEAVGERDWSVRDPNAP